MASEREILKESMRDSLHLILDAEKKFIEKCTHNDLTIKEFHLIETVLDAQKIGNNNFSFVANKLGITLGTLTTAFAKLEKKKYLQKENFPIDQRVYYIVPTEKARKIQAKYKAWNEKIIDDTLKNVPGKNLYSFINALNSLSWAINKQS